MSSLVKLVSAVATDVKGRVEEAMVDLTGSRTHNFIDPLVSNCVVRNPTVPVCCSMPTGRLELGTLIAISGVVAGSMFAKRFLHSFADCVGDACTTDTNTTRFHKLDIKRSMFRIDFLAGNCQHGPQRHETASISSSNSNSSLASASLPEGTNLAFHFNPRFASSGESNVVVMNSRSGSEWGQEQRETQNFPFELGKPFNLMILVEEDGFKLAVNGKHMWAFRHRFDFKEIVRMHIEGHLSVELIEFRRELKYVKPTTYPTSSSSSSSSSSTSGDDKREQDGQTKVQIKMVQVPDVPYKEYDSRLGGSCNIYISGRLSILSSKAFVVNLGSSGNLGVVKVIPFHMSIRPEEKAIVRNSRENETWGVEERNLVNQGGFPIQTGTPFDMLLSKNANKILVAINGQFAFEFAHRLSAKLIDTLEITGGVELASIRYEFL